MSAALELGIRITVAPFTPPTAPAQWATPSDGPENATVVVRMDNNDSFYVDLSQESRWRRAPAPDLPARRSPATPRCARHARALPGARRSAGCQATL
eukprot:4345102-Pyramimonas_sp.AAC.1